MRRVPSIAARPWFDFVLQSCAVVLATIVLCTLGTSPAVAQGTWEYSPYEIRLWVAVANQPELPASLAEEIDRAVIDGCRGSAGYAWKLLPEASPALLRDDLIDRLDSVAFEQMILADRTVLRGDKLLVISVVAETGGFDVNAREFDSATRQGSETLRFTTSQREAIPQIAAQAAVDVIRPLAKVSKVEGRAIQARFRAGGLVDDPASPAVLGPGAPMVPVVRRNARNGQPMPGGIFAPPWSYVMIDSVEEGIVKGTMSSGFGSVFPVKGGARTERLMLGMKARHDATRLHLRTKAVAASSKSKGSPGKVLAGYEVFVKRPGDDKTTLVGLTDWNGTIELPRSEKPLQLFFIRNGGQLLGRLPMVVGEHAEATANVVDDEPRLLAESYVRALQSRVMDLVARREILAVRIRAKVKKGDYPAAKQMVEELRRLPSRGDLIRELEETQRRMSNTPGLSGKRIAKLFQDGQRLLVKFLDPAVADQLAREIAAAETRGSAPPEASAPTAEPVPAATVPAAAGPIQAAPPASATPSPIPSITTPPSTTPAAPMPMPSLALPPA